MAPVAIAGMAAPEGTAVIGAMGRTMPDGVWHQQWRCHTLRPELERLKPVVASPLGRQLSQSIGALCASRGKPFLASQAIPRWQSHYADYMGNGAHMRLWQAASNRLISCCIRLYFNWKSSTYGCQTVPCFYHRLPSSLAAREGRRRQYQYHAWALAGSKAMAANRGAYCAA